MKKICFLCLGLLPVLSGQTSIGDGFVATSTRTLIIPPTHALVNASVTSERSLDEILAKLKDAEFTVEHLRQVTTTPGFESPIPGGSVPSRTVYTFTREVPLAQTTAALDRIRQFARANTDFPTVAQMGGVKPTDAAIQEAQRRAFKSLYEEAKSRAEEMAREAGLSPGKVLAAVDTYGAAGVYGLYTTFQVPMAVSIRIAIN